ncbi:cytochrome P450 [Marinoscillum sp. MHG1-6]|uniref:cytochrome P450 n=1 Tax=Marinoscillum sp. MHG1-6 TaxID=2959627 RepID=UPI0021576780|nr:cytochrome P450 [Marinoscillum sp. MHG1-6]
MQAPKAFPEHNSFQNLKTFKKDPLAYMKAASERHGSPVNLHLPMGKFVLVSDADQFNEVFLKEREYYQKSKGYKEIALVLGNGLLTAEGEEWHEQRKALQPSFHKNELRKLLPAIWETGADYITKLGKGNLLRLDTEMSGLTMTILLNSLIKYQDQEMVEKMGEHILFGQDFIVDRIRSPFKWPVWVPTKANRRYHSMMKEADYLIQRCVDDRKMLTKTDVNDLLGVLMKQYDPDNQFSEIRNQILTFLVAGHETSAIAMTWTLHLLAHHPEIQQKLYAEIAEIDGLEDLDLMNFTGLEYTQKVIKESLRYYPPIWNIVRKAVKENEIGEHTIVEDEQVMLNIYLMHHNSTYWKNPEVFDPERFDKEARDGYHKFQYLPFGAGGRFCIGNNFALFEIMILLIQFVKKYEIRPKSPEHVPFNPLLTLRPKDAVEVELMERVKA